MSAARLSPTNSVAVGSTGVRGKYRVGEPPLPMLAIDEPSGILDAKLREKHPIRAVTVAVAEHERTPTPGELRIVPAERGPVAGQD